MPAYAHDTSPHTPAASSRPPRLLAAALRVQPDRVAGALPPGDQAWMAIRELSAAAIMEAAL